MIKFPNSVSPYKDMVKVDNDIEETLCLIEDSFDSGPFIFSPAHAARVRAILILLRTKIVLDTVESNKNLDKITLNHTFIGEVTILGLVLGLIIFLFSLGQS